jgi:predicted O-methyltransferase YrrM
LSNFDVPLITDKQLNYPVTLELLQRDDEALAFRLASDPLTGSLLRTLAAIKPDGRILELGTGTGVGTAWLLDGMDSESRLISVDNDPNVIAVAKRYLEVDRRVTFFTEDAASVLSRLPKAAFDLIFADAWIGKYTHLEETLHLLKPGGLYVIDDMLPQTSWPSDHRQSANRLVHELERRIDLVITKITWSTGIIIAAKRG